MSQDLDANVIDFQKESIESLHKKAVQRFNRLTYAIIGEVSSLLKKAKVMPLSDLQNHNPTFEEVVNQLRVFRALSEAAAKALGIDKAEELNEVDMYIDLADELAKAIASDDFDSLCGAIAALDSKPYI
ncbi:hypothetical protein J9788_01055 [Serratia sp. X10]|uniref:hypothetical protein n=1 Tax=Serratia sp. X10 TaxID=2782608 RepID=UPI00351C265B|nr:hypothetical protein [Serratia sp. X10]